jgi:hypothetical protein
MSAFGETDKYVPCWRNALLQSVRRYKSIKTTGLLLLWVQLQKPYQETEPTAYSNTNFMYEVTDFPASLILIEAQYYREFRSIFSCRKHLGEKSRILFLLWHFSGAW